jgi:hypothetical protein
VRDGLLTINVLAGAHRVDGDADVPVIGCGDRDGIDVLAVEDLALVHVLGGIGGRSRFGPQAARFVNIADSDHLVARVLLEGVG